MPANCRQRGGKSWAYLQETSLNASLVLVPHRRGSSQVALANSQLSSEEADAWYVEGGMSFEKALMARINHIRGNGKWATREGPDRDPYLINLLASTTIVMQMMEHIGHAQAQKILGYRLSGGATLEGTERETLAHNKVIQLCRIIDGATQAITHAAGDPRHGPKGVVFFNYRVGDVNKQHNATPGILNDVRMAAAAHG